MQLSARGDFRRMLEAIEMRRPVGWTLPVDLAREIAVRWEQQAVHIEAPDRGGMDSFLI